jgi:hypothetical protein
MKLFSAASVCVFTFLCLAGSARSGTNGFLVPTFRGSANSAAGYWETFTVATGSPGNRPERPGATTGAVLTQHETNAFLTGSGNIYNLGGASEFTITDATPFNIGTVVLQARVLGSELHYNSVSLTYSNASGEHSVGPLARVELNRGNQPGLGVTVSTLWQWDLSGLDVASYTISFRAAAVSLSFDAVTLDTSDGFVALFTQPFNVSDTSPAIERWMYAFNAAPCDRPAGSVFGSFGDDTGVDSRHAQFLLGWNTAGLIRTNRGPSNYLIRRCRVTLTINRGNLFAYDPTQDDFRTYFETNHPSVLADGDTGRPIELFGAGFRYGYDATTFTQCSPFGTNAPGQRNAYAAGWSTNGTLVDVSNNVGKTNEAFPRFEVAPFAVGQTTNVAPGELVPAGARITFELNLNDPFVLEYLQAALNGGQLRFMVTSLHATAGQFGTPSYPDFATHFNEAVVTPTRLELEGVTLGGGDMDADGLPDDWELACLNTLTHNATSDPDGDGSANRSEFLAETDPLRGNSLFEVLLARGETGVTLRFSHSANRRYAVEFSDDLSAWTALPGAPVFELPLGIARWVDNSANSAKRFYRVRAELIEP